MKRPLIFFLLILAAFAALAASYFHVLDNYELKTLDIRFSLRPKIPVTDKVVLVEIGDDTIEKIGSFPFDRSYHALLVKALSESGASAIVFDIFFSEPHEHDQDLEDAVKRAGNVYLPCAFDLGVKQGFDIPSASGYVANDLERFSAAAKGVGHINIFPDIDGKFRRIPLYVRYEDSLHPSISFLAGLDHLGINSKDVRIFPGRYADPGNGIKIPLDEHSNMIVNYTGRWGDTYKHYSYIDIVQSYLMGEDALDLSVFRDKVCIVGLTAAGTADLHPTPFETHAPGVGVHAEVFNALVTGNFVARAGRWTNMLILIVLCLLVCLLGLKLKPIAMLFTVIGIVFSFALASVLLFNLAGIWIDLLYPVMITLLCYVGTSLRRYIVEWKSRLLLDNELLIAKKIQLSFLPEKVPAVKGLEIAASMFTARQVGGDLYDFIELGPERLGVMIGDVSGKGVPASLFMSIVTDEFGFFAKPDVKPEDAIFELNSALIKKASSGLYVTMFYAIFDMGSRVMSYANGGHLPVILSSPGKGLKMLNAEGGLPPGMMESSYGGGSEAFAGGDVFVFYTDGVTEATRPDGSMYCEERLRAVVDKNRDLPPKALLDAIEKDIRRFEPKKTQHDDITLMIVKVE